MSKYMYVGILLLVAVLCFSVLGSAQPKFKIGYTSECFGTAYSISLVNGATDAAQITFKYLDSKRNGHKAWGSRSLPSA